MATWHITVDPSIASNIHIQGAIHTLVLKPIVKEFERLGFTVHTMPEVSSVALSVSHTSESAITLYLLRYGSDNIHIERVS